VDGGGDRFRLGAGGDFYPDEKGGSQVRAANEPQAMDGNKRMKIVVFVTFVWGLALVVHLLAEAWIIAARGFDKLPPCRHWWCPEGMKNLVTGDR
jgi:hypothetical protein